MVAGAGGARSTVPRAGGGGIGCKPPVTPVAIDRSIEILVQRKAAPRQLFQRRAVTPVEGQKPPGLTGGRAGDPGAFDDDRLNAATAQKVGDRGPDHTAATDDDPHVPPLRLWSGRRRSPKGREGTRSVIARSCCEGRWTCRQTHAVAD